VKPPFSSSDASRFDSTGTPNFADPTSAFVSFRLSLPERWARMTWWAEVASDWKVGQEGSFFVQALQGPLSGGTRSSTFRLHACSLFVIVGENFLLRVVRAA